MMKNGVKITSKFYIYIVLLSSIFEKYQSLYALVIARAISPFRESMYICDRTSCNLKFCSLSLASIGWLSVALKGIGL